MLVRKHTKIISKDEIEKYEQSKFDEDMLFLQSLVSIEDVSSNSFDIKKVILNAINKDVLEEKYKSLFFHILNNYQTYQLKEFDELYKSKDFFHFCVQNQQYLKVESEEIMGYYSPIKPLLIAKLLEEHMVQPLKKAFANHLNSTYFNMFSNNEDHFYFQSDLLGNTGGYLAISLNTFNSDKPLKIRFSVEFPMYTRELERVLQNLPFNTIVLEKSILLPLYKVFSDFAKNYNLNYEERFRDINPLVRPYLTNNDTFQNATFQFEYTNFFDDLKFDMNFPLGVEQIILSLERDIELVKDLHQQHFRKLNEFMNTLPTEDSLSFMSESEVSEHTQKFFDAKTDLDETTKHFVYVSMLHIFDDIHLKRVIPKKENKFKKLFSKFLR